MTTYRISHSPNSHRLWKNTCVIFFQSHQLVFYQEGSFPHLIVSSDIAHNTHCKSWSQVVECLASSLVHHSIHALSMEKIPVCEARTKTSSVKGTCLVTLLINYLAFQILPFCPIILCVCGLSPTSSEEFISHECSGGRPSG